MTTSDSALSDLAARLAGTDPSLSTSLRDILTAALQELIEAELTNLIGAAPGERSPERTALRNGHRPKLLSTPAGDVELVDRGLDGVKLVISDAHAGLIKVQVRSAARSGRVASPDVPLGRWRVRFDDVDVRSPMSVARRATVDSWRSPLKP